MKKLIYFILILIPYLSYSQNDTISNQFSVIGIITDSLNNNKLDYVNITLLNCKDSSFIKSGHTTENGKFIIKNIPENEYILRVNYIGYNSLYEKIILSENIDLKLYLKKSDIAIDDITITSNKEIYRLEPDKRIYITKNDESIQNAFADNALENVPGVYIDIEGNVIIRGQKATVWINGKPSKRNAENLKSFLKLLPASRIEKIELITNPSARYTATNTNSIVNIVLQKKVNDNSLSALGTVINTNNIFGLWATTFITKNKFDFNIYAIGSKSSRKMEFFDKSYSASNQDTAFYTEYKKNEIYKHIGGTIFGELNYHISTDTDIGLILEYGNYTITELFETVNIRKYENPNRIESEIEDKKNPYTFFLNANFNHNFKKEGHTLGFEFNTYKVKYNNSFSKKEDYKLSDMESYWQSSPDNEILSINFLANYTYPFKDKYVFTAGLHFYPIDNQANTKIVRTSANTNNNWNIEPALSNDFSEKKPSYQVYSTFSGEIFSIKYKIGIRYEHNIYDIKQTIPVYNAYKIYRNLYPSIHLSYKTKSKHNFSVSYSRRVNTPIYNLNPYIDRTNNDFINSGNPDLNYASTNSYEFTYFKGFKNINITASIYHRNTKRDIIQVSEPVYDDYFGSTVVLQTYANCADSKFIGTEISLSSSPVKNLRLQLYSNTYYQDLSGTYNDLAINKTDFVYNIRMNISYKIFNNIFVKISPYYKSDNTSIFRTKKGDFYTNASVKFDLWKKRISFDISARDIFGTKEVISEYYLNNFYHYSEKDYVFRSIQFILILRIGNSKYDRQAKINKLAS